jgi:chromosome segregation ATPase
MEEEIETIGKQYQRLNSHYQNVFNKLHIYTETLKEKQSMKEGYEQVLKEITKAEEEVKVTHQAEIVQLRILNQGLKQQVTECIIEKEEFAECINQLATSVSALKANEEKKQQAAFKEVQRVISEAGTRFNTSLKDPLSFLDSCLEGSKE